MDRTAVSEMQRETEKQRDRGVSRVTDGSTEVQGPLSAEREAETLTEEERRRS